MTASDRAYVTKSLQAGGHPHMRHCPGVRSVISKQTAAATRANAPDAPLADLAAQIAERKGLPHMDI